MALYLRANDERSADVVPCTPLGDTFDGALPTVPPIAAGQPELRLAEIV
jgi:hypothetical protein